MRRRTDKGRIMKFTRYVAWLIVGAGLSGVSSLLAAQSDYPNKPIRFIVPFPPGGTGTGNHLTMELFNAMAGIRVVHVPYKGAPLAITDLIAGQVQVMTPPMPATVPHIKAGRLKALAVTSAKRNKAVPELPTVAEAGVPGYDADSWYGVLVPAGTPKTIIDKLHAGIIKILTTPEVATYLANQGAEVSTTTPAQFGSFIKTEVAKWAKVVKIASIRLE